MKKIFIVVCVLVFLGAALFMLAAANSDSANYWGAGAGEVSSCLPSCGGRATPTKCPPYACPRAPTPTSPPP